MNKSLDVYLFLTFLVIINKNVNNDVTETCEGFLWIKKNVVVTKLLRK